MTMPDAMQPVTTALVLAGGKGERLRPLTDDRPKPMVLINGLPLLEYHLRWLRSQGVERAVLLTGYLGNVIEEYFSVPRVPGLHVECVHEERPLGRGGAFKKGYQLAGQGNALAIATNGDVLTDQALLPMLELHANSNALATVMVAPMLSPYGVVDVDGDSKVASFREKPTLPFWINAGVYVFSAEVLERFPDVGDHETEVFPALAKEGRIAAYRSEAYWKSVETAKDLREAEEFLANHDTFNQGATA